MDYREIASPVELRHLVKLAWTLAVPDDGPEWVTHVATPDGCVEIIRRLKGRSRWGGAQPASFAAGMLTCPAHLRLSRGSRFVGVRIWPWTWRALTGRSPAQLADRWAALDTIFPGFVLPVEPAACFAAVSAAIDNPPSPRTTASILTSRSCAEIVALSGLSPRSLQRWFDRNVGVPPRTYLRILRFGDAFAGLPDADASLAQHALDHGFSDQPHMAREFRSLAGTPALGAKQRGQGPFISGPAPNRG